MFFSWLKLTLTNEEFCSIPFAKVTMDIAMFATVAAAAVVEHGGEARGTVGQRLAEIVHRVGFPKTAFPV